MTESASGSAGSPFWRRPGAQVQTQLSRVAVYSVDAFEGAIERIPKFALSAIEGEAQWCGGMWIAPSVGVGRALWAGAGVNRSWIG